MIKEKITAEELEFRDLNTREELMNIRIVGGCSLFNDEINFGDHNHIYRCVSCYKDYDIVECKFCGKQLIEKCSFDDEYN